MIQKIQKNILFLICIIVILFVFFFYIPMWFGHKESKVIQAKYEIKIFCKALEEYKKVNGKYPTTAEGLVSVFTLKGTNNIVLPSIKDPWGRQYKYIYPGAKNKKTYDLWSLGADNLPGGEDENIDISNW